MFGRAHRNDGYRPAPDPDVEPPKQKVRRREGTWSDYATRLGSFLAILAIVFGVPALLVWFAGNPLPDSIPPWDNIRGRLESGSIPSEVLINVVAIVLWFWWLNLVVPIIVELISTLRSVTGPNLLLLPGSQMLARNLVAGLFVLTNTFSSLGGAPSLAGVSAVPAVTQVEHDSSGYRAVAELSQDRAELAEADERAAAADEARELLYEVKRGDTLRSLAERALGDASRWREVRSASVGLAQADGAVLPPTFTSLAEGMTLRLPAGIDPAMMDDLRDLRDSPPPMTAVTTSDGEGLVEGSASDPSDDGAVEETSAADTADADADTADTDADTADSDAESEAPFVVAEGDHFWKVAEHEVRLADLNATTEDIDRYWRALIAANDGTYSVSGDPDLIYPGATMTIVDVYEVLDIERVRVSIPTPPDTAAVEDTEAESVANEGTHKTTDKAAPDDDDIDWWLAPRDAGLFADPADAPSDESSTPVDDVAPDVVAPDEVAPDDSETDDSETETETETATDSETEQSGAGAATTVGRPDPPPPRTSADTDGTDNTLQTDGASETEGADTDQADESVIDLTTAALVGVGTTVAAGVLHRLGHMRSTQQRRRPRHHDAVPPTPEVCEVESQLRAIASRETLQWIEATQRALVQVGTSPPGDAPAISLIRAGAQGLEMLFDTKAPAPPDGFVAVDRVWGIAEGTTLDALATDDEGPVPLMPALVTLGEQVGHVVMLDLERAGLLELRGDPARGALLRNSIALELATAPWAEDVRVVSVGGDPSLGDLPGVRVVDPDTDDWQTELLALAEETSAVVGQSASTHDARCGDDPADSFAPTVVLIADDVALTDELIDAALSPVSGLAIVTQTLTRSPWRFEIHPDGMALLDPTGMSMRAAGLRDSVVAAVLENMTSSEDFSPRPEADGEAGWGVPFEPAIVDTEWVANDARTHPGDSADATPDVTVRLDRINADITLVPDPEPEGDSSTDTETAGTDGESDPAEDPPEAVVDALAFIAEIAEPAGVELTIFGSPTLTGDLAGKATRRDIEITGLLALKSPPPGVQAVSEAIFNRGAAFTDQHTAPAHKTVLSAVSRTRSALGESETAGRRLPRGTRNSAGYQLVDVGVDWHRCETLIERARTTPHPAGRALLLKAALTYVQGQPLEGIVDDSWGWAFGDRDIVSLIEARTTDAAIELADLAMDLDDPTLAGWAAERGVMVVRGHAVLYRQMMKAYAAEEGPDGARRAYNEYMRVTRDIDPHEEPDPVTVRLLGVLVRGGTGDGEFDADDHQLADVVSMTAR